MSENDTEFPDYITFARSFEKYKWYKPILVIVICAVLYFIFQIILGLIFNVIYGETILSAIMNGGYETLNTSDASVYYSYLSIALFIPSLYLSSKIVRDRPFSSYSSSRGGWNWKLYFKCMTIPITIYILYCAITLIIHPEPGAKSQVSLVTVIIATVLIPLQCIGEEYMFRGLAMQTIGAWFKIPVLAILVQAIIFAIGHSYDIKGMIAVGISGVIFGLLAWKSSGLEAGAAIHSANNLMSFYIVALGLGSLSSTVSMWDFIADIALTSFTAFALYYIGTRKEWFLKKTPESRLAFKND